MKFLTPLALAVFLAACTSEEDGPNASISNMRDGDTLRAVLSIMEDRKTECLTFTAAKSKVDFGGRITTIFLYWAPVEELEADESFSGLFTVILSGGSATYRQADVDIDAVTRTRVTGTYRLLDTNRAPLTPVKTFEAMRCPDSESTQEP